MEKYITHSAEETKKVAKKIASKINHGAIALTGDLGAGKTTFVQGFAKGLGIKDKIISPTFVLIRIHKIPKSRKTLFHIDLYRLETPKQFEALGLEEIINDPSNIVLIEWAEKIEKLLPDDTIHIALKIINNNTRSINIS